MAHNQPFGTLWRQRGKCRWLRVGDMPFSRGHTYDLIEEGILVSVALGLPGSKRPVRLIDAESLDKYLLKLSKQQQAAKATARKEVEAV